MGKTGLSAQLGIGVESTWGTRVVPTRFVEILNESIKLDLQRVESQGLRAGRRFSRAYHANRKGAGGTVAFEWPTAGGGLIAKHILGAVATTTPVGGTLSRDHLATPGDFDGKSLTVQVGRPDFGGTVRPFDYVGGKIVQAEFSNAVDGILQCVLTFDFQDEKTDQTLATASYPSALSQFFFAGAKLTIGGVDIDVRDISCLISAGLKTDRYYLRNSTLKKEQIEDTAPRDAGGNFTADFTSMSLYDSFVAGTEATLSALWRSPIAIEGSIYPELEIAAARVRFDGETPNVQGPDVLTQPVPWKALEPAVGNTISLRVRSADATP